MPTSPRLWAVAGLKLLLSLGLVVYLVARIDWATLAGAWAHADHALLVGALLVLAPVPLLAAARWRQIALAADIRLSRRFFHAAIYAALFAGQFLPAGVGTDAVRVGLLWQRKIALRAAFLSVAIDRACGIAGIGLLVVAGLPWALVHVPSGIAHPVLVLGAILGVTGAAAVLAGSLPWSARWRHGLPGRAAALLRSASAIVVTRHFLLALFASCVLHLVSIVAILLALRAFGHAPRLVDLVSIAALAIFVGMLPISFNGWGVREGAMVVGLGWLAIPGESALLASLLFGVGGALWALPGSVAWLRLRAGARGAVPRQ